MNRRTTRLVSPSPAHTSTFHQTDYRLVIATALDARPFDEESLHDCVCTYVRAERDRGRSPGDVIVALTELVEQKDIASPRLRYALTRQVIPWCVAAYFAGAPERRPSARGRR